MYPWERLWALGAVLLIAGGVLLFVPAAPDGPHTVTPPVLETQQRWYWVEDNVTGFTVTGTVPLTVEWSSSAVLYLDYAICPRPQSNLSGFFNGGYTIAGCSENYGLQGSSSDLPSTSVPAGGSVILGWALTQFGPQNVSITYTLWTGLTIAGPVLLTLGPVSVGLGVFVLKRFQRRRAQAGSARNRNAGSGPGGT